MPIQFGTLKYLQVLDVSYNALSGVLSDIFTGIPYTEIRFNNNQLTGRIPAAFSTLGATLTYLDVSMNDFFGNFYNLKFQERFQVEIFLPR